MQPVYKMEWRPIKHHKNPQMRSTIEEEYQKEMEKIERKRKQMQKVKELRKEKYFNPNLDKKSAWEKMNSEFDQQRKVKIFLNKINKLRK